jgi:hypothetical protein
VRRTAFTLWRSATGHRAPVRGARAGNQVASIYLTGRQIRIAMNVPAFDRQEEWFDRRRRADIAGGI